MEKKRALSRRDFDKLRDCFELQLVHEVAKKRKVEVYLVGGVLRDLFLKKPLQRDFDMAVKGETKALVAEIAVPLKAHFFPLDESLGIWRLVFRKGKKKGEMDFSTLGDKDIEADLGQRDFSINSLALPLNTLFSNDTPYIIDPLNGINDLKHRRLRINSDASLLKDPLRMLRAFRLAANLNLQIEDHTFYLIKKNKNFLSHSAGERIRTEFFALLNEKKAAFFLRYLFQAGILEELFPEIKGWQDISPGPYHDFSLLEHAYKTVEAAEFIIANLQEIFPSWAKTFRDYFNELVEEGVTRQALFKFGAFFHDAGKPISYSWSSEAASLRFYDHDQKGKQINRQICQRLKLSRGASKFIAEMTGQHMRILTLAQLGEVTTRAKYRFFHDLGKRGIELALLSLADKLATRQIKFQWPLPLDSPDDLLRIAEVVQELIRYYQEDFVPQKKGLLLNGQEIMEAFSLTPGEKIGELLARLQKAENAGLIQSKDEAWKFLKAQVYANGETKGG